MNDFEKSRTVALLIMSLVLVIFVILGVYKDTKFDTILFGSYTIFSLIKDLMHD